ncbi:MAG: ATPase [Candidatus Eisenbacteria bacterium]|nr:ATPase [Candidatus Eisenbacteria bacterium]
MPRGPGDIEKTLGRIDRRGYKAYKDLRGEYEFPGFRLCIDHVQGDPFASPSRVRLVVPSERAGFPQELYSDPTRNRAFCDFLTREVHAGCRRVSSRAGTGKSGLIEIDRPVQEVLERTSVNAGEERIEARISVGLPAAGRRVLADKARDILLRRLPSLVESSLLSKSVDADALDTHLRVVEDQVRIRAELADRGLVAFVGRGAVLPRRSGIDPRPMKSGAIPFEPPPELTSGFELSDGRVIEGLGIPEGVTLIVGGGYHGKSTLLSAVELGVYDHVPGDGRELVVTRPDAVKIRAEDGRSVAGVDISPFIAQLPFGGNTRDFSTQNASGSTSQAANIIEALECGTSLLLIDEDTSATNFMIRDRRMQELVAKEGEPITPFIDKIRQMYEELGISTVIVVGGAGDYFDVADTVIRMDSYRPVDVTAQTKEIARRHPSERNFEGGESFGKPAARIPDPTSIDPSRGRRREKVDARGWDSIRFGRGMIDLSSVEQLVTVSQTRAIGDALLLLKRLMNGRRTVPELLDALEEELGAVGLDALSRFKMGGYARPRRQEVAAALSRLRSLRVKQTS